MLRAKSMVGSPKNAEKLLLKLERLTVGGYLINLPPIGVLTEDTEWHMSNFKGRSGMFIIRSLARIEFNYNSLYRHIIQNL